MQNESFRYCGIIFLVAVVLYATNLAGPVLWDVDEARFASCSAELYRSGNWIVPLLNGEIYGTKPIMMFWLMMLSYTFFGINEFAARFPSFFFAIATLLLTYKLGSFLFDRKVGFWAAISLAVSLVFSVEARGATPDSPLIFSVTAALYVWAVGTFRSPKKQDADSPETALQLRFEGHYYPQETWRVVAIYLIMGFGVLVKGPLACVVPTAIIGMFLLIKRLPDHSDLPEPRMFYEKCGRYFYLALKPFAPVHFLQTVRYMRPFTAILAIAVVALPWYLLVGWKTGFFAQGGYWYEFLYVNNFQRATTPFDGHGGTLMYNPILYYPVSILFGFFPWSLFAIPAVWETIKQFRAKTPWNDSLLLVFCWALVWMGCFSVAATKLPSYITPMYPAFAMLIGIYMRNWLDEKTLVEKYWPKVAFAVGIFVGLAIMIAGSILVSILISSFEIYLPILLGLIVFVGCASCVISLRTETPIATLTSFTLTAIFFTGFLHVAGANRIATYHPARAIGAEIRQCQLDADYKKQSDQEPQPIRVVVHNCFRQSWVFYAERPFERFSGTTEELVQMLEKERPEILIVPAAIADEHALTPAEYSVREFRDFNFPERTTLRMFVRVN